MNYYEHHLGDYMRDTAHLSMLEDAAYRRLLDAYYVREKPLPLDPKECAKLARATSKPERDAVAYVLREFFEQREDGYHQRRADAEIARFQDKSAKARASIEKRWERVRVENERNTNVSDSNVRTYNEGNTPRARPQTPDTRHQSQTGSSSSHGEFEASARDDDGNPPAPPDAVPGEQDLPDWVPRAEWREFYAHRGVIRKPLSLFGQREVVKRLAELRNDGHNLAESLRQTMRAGLAIPVIPKEPDHATRSGSRKLSAVEQVEAAIRERREREAAGGSALAVLPGDDG